MDRGEDGLGRRSEDGVFVDELEQGAQAAWVRELLAEVEEAARQWGRVVELVARLPPAAPVELPPPAAQAEQLLQALAE